MTCISTISRDLSDRCLCYQAVTFKSATCVLDLFNTHTNPPDYICSVDHYLPYT